MACRTEIVKEGYMNKAPPPRKALAHWHKRFFVLWSSKLMEYYSSSEKRPQDYLKSIDLGRCEDLVAPVHLSRHINLIKLTIKEGAKVRDYLLECETSREMNLWVQNLVEVLGFTPDDSQDLIPDQQPPTMNSPSLRPRLPTPPSSEHSKRPRSEKKQPAKSPPKPPPKPRDNQIAIDGSAGDEQNYHILVSGDSLDEPQGYYEEMGFDIEEFQKNPAPVWKPPTPAPPHSRTKARRWVRTLERKGEAKPHTPTLKPPIKQPLKANMQSRPLPAPSNLNNGNGSMWSHEDEGSEMTSYSQVPLVQAAPYEEHVPSISEERVRKPGPQPPAKPKAGGVAFGFNLKGDLKFQQKLHEKRQELYGVRDDAQLDLAQDQYEEIAFTGTTDSIPQALAPSGRLKRPPIKAAPSEALSTFVMVENEEGYIDVEPADVTQEEYSEVGVCDRASSPSVDWETTGPPLPPREDRSNRSPSPRPNWHNPRSHRQLSASKSIDIPSLASLQPGSRASLSTSPPPPVPSSQRRVSFPVISPPPPPLPSREIKRRQDSPPPLPQKDRPMSPAHQKERLPMPLPSQRLSVSPPLPRPFLSVLPPPSESVDSPPPVPRRHPQHSDKPRGISRDGPSSFPTRTSVNPPREGQQAGEGPPVPQRLRGSNSAPPPVSRRHSDQPTLAQAVHLPKEHSHKPRAPAPPPKPTAHNLESSNTSSSNPRGPKPMTKAKPAVLPKPKPRSTSHPGPPNTRPKPLPPVLPRKS